jgi:hypothetical protein
MELIAVSASDVMGPEVNGDLIRARNGSRMSSGATCNMSIKDTSPTTLAHGQRHHTTIAEEQPIGMLTFYCHHLASQPDECR